MEIKNRIETLEEAVEEVIDGMREGQGFDALAEQESIYLFEEAERYIDTYLLQHDCPHNPFKDADELEKAIGVSYTVLIEAVAKSIAETILNDVRCEYFNYRFSAEKIAEIEEWFSDNSKLRTINEIISAYSSIADFARTFDIPYRTAQDWSLCNSAPPRWVVKLLDKAAVY